VRTAWASAAYDEAVNVIGARLGDGEQVLREIGRGAHAHVYLVSDGERVRALKLFPAEQERRVQHEFSIGCDLDHPNVNRVDTMVEVVGRPGLLMPLVQGRRLAMLGRSARARNAYLSAFEGLLRGLGYLHARGIVHGDVKPENVLVDPAGRARLIDFDLSLREDSALRTRGIFGTIAYLSPEQARGERPAPASDLYAAGVMLLAALTGEVPFTGSISDVVAAHRATVPPLPSAHDPALGSFDAFSARLLAKDPRERFASGGEAEAALRALRADEGAGGADVAGRMDG
jgi:eukaryotic-like serine/threonine-protein kinase